jgi:hypothetical protein
LAKKIKNGHTWGKKTFVWDCNYLLLLYNLALCWTSYFCIDISKYFFYWQGTPFLGNVKPFACNVKHLLGTAKTHYCSIV